MKKTGILIVIVMLMASILFAASFPSIPNNFQPKQLISSAKVMANYNALLNGIIDGTKKINVNELWINGTRVIDSSRDMVLASITVTGNITASANFVVVGTITANYFVGDGSGITNIPVYITANSAYGSSTSAPTNSVFVLASGIVSINKALYASAYDLKVVTSSYKTNVNISGNLATTGSFRTYLENTAVSGNLRTDVANIGVQVSFNAAGTITSATGMEIKGSYRGTTLVGRGLTIGSLENGSGGSLVGLRINPISGNAAVRGIEIANVASNGGTAYDVYGTNTSNFGELHVGGTNVNTGGTLTNVAYLDQENGFSATQNVTGSIGVNVVVPSSDFHVNNLFTITPLATTPSVAHEGLTFYNSTTSHVLVYLGGAWKQLD